MLVAWSTSVRRHRQLPGQALAEKVLPSLYQGLLWYFESVMKMLDNSIETREPVELSEVLAVVAAEAATRAIDGNSVAYDGVRYDDADHHSTISITTNLAPDMKITGDPAMLHLLFYQFIKNAVKELKSDRAGGSLAIRSGRFDWQGHRGIAVQVVDSGRGINLTEVIRSKQRQAKADPTSPQAAEYNSNYRWLNFSIHQAMQLIFERKVSGSGTRNSSGLGMAMASMIAAGHHCSVWVTNVQEQGAGFLFLFEEEGSSDLHAHAPELFAQDVVPAAALEAIEQQLAMNV
jgi:signal transduction histidine kinase